ncbi:MAG: DUF354 domain-containing protein [Thaumarchaeota archaeon]|nr:DUF354 domain-containing protein [Candidatus Calditenuaceae archaeon]MDW8043543.1 DUF354 domain-containing protein [Nitrososphaerota archaeon]
MGCDVLFDVLTPKQALFFWAVGRELEARGIEVSYVARDYEQLDWVERELRLGALKVGRFGGEGLEGKLVASTERQAALIDVLKELRPKIAASSGSIELCRVAYGLAVRHYLASDTPHSPVNRVCVPLSDLVATPRYIPVSEWRRWATPSTRFLRYRALDPIAWIRRLEGPVSRSAGRRYVLVRPPERKASYLRSGGLEETSAVIRALRSNYEGEVLVVARYRDDASQLSGVSGDRVKVLNEPTLLLPLIAGADAVFSGGGTTAQEAALLGVPTFTFYPGEIPAVHRFLIRRGLLKEVDPEKRSIAAAIELAMESGFRRRLMERARRLRGSMEDPAEALANAIAAGLE